MGADWLARKRFVWGMAWSPYHHLWWAMKSPAIDMLGLRLRVGRILEMCIYFPGEYMLSMSMSVLLTVIVSLREWLSYELTILALRLMSFRMYVAQHRWGLGEV